MESGDLGRLGWHTSYVSSSYRGCFIDNSAIYILLLSDLDEIEAGSLDEFFRGL